MPLLLTSRNGDAFALASPAVQPWQLPNSRDEAFFFLRKRLFVSFFEAAAARLEGPAAEPVETAAEELEGGGGRRCHCC